ncbi:MAG: hypothetical protein KAJ96_00425 [Candidatus Thorarchaeota archaeon]|nr:hypothetical protein [Candidatus Thorarchaeota archaeon]
MRMCAKCGKANDVLRKHCTRCGASLLKEAEDSKPKPSTSIPESGRVVTGSTVEELEEPEEAVSPEPVQVDYKEGKEVVKKILERVKAAETRAKDEETASQPETDVEVLEEEPPEEMAEPMIPEGPTAEAEMPYDEPAAPPPEEVREQKPAPVAPQSMVSAAVEDHVRDERIRNLESDIKAFNTERGQLQSELDKLRSRLDEGVERYHTVAETKRTRAERIERELSLAKKEYNDANNEYKNAENRRKKELSNAEKRIRDMDKRVKKAHDAKDKRIRDLEKERLKREEDAKKG